MEDISPLFVVRRSQLAKVVRGSRSASDSNLTTWVVYYEIDNWFFSISRSRTNIKISN